MVIIRVVYIVFLLLPFSRPEITCKTDTLKVKAIGENNQVLVNGVQINPEETKSDTFNIAGQITQNGCSNSVKISTSKDTTVKNQQIKISQTGSNNKVKINTQ